jgi:multimeric flavodoxin WrbA
MKIALINGSPKHEGSASGIILEALRCRLSGDCEFAAGHAAKDGVAGVRETVAGCGAIVFAFPLYVDGIPSHLLRVLDSIQGEVAVLAPKAVVYAIANNGFYEGRQNALALEMMRHFCDASGLAWGQGMGAGGGGMMDSAPIGGGR